VASILLDMVAAPLRRFGRDILNGALLIPVLPDSGDRQSAPPRFAEPVRL